MIRSNQDLYAAVDALREELRRAGEERWDLALHDAMYISTVPGEILGEIRLTLRELRRTDVAARIRIGDRIDEMLIVLDEALG